MQVVSEFRMWRMEICKHGVNYENNWGQLWSMLVQEKAMGFGSDDSTAPFRYENIYKLYILSVMIPTSSTDVERGFSLHKLILGSRCTTVQVQNIDTRLRGMTQVKQILERLGCQWAGSPESLDTTTLHPYQLYHRLLDGKTDFLTVALHAKLAKKNSAEWLEMFQATFEVMPEQSEEDVGDFSGGATVLEMQESVLRMTELLAHGV
jgi:hypothetical protein